MSSLADMLSDDVFGAEGDLGEGGADVGDDADGPLAEFGRERVVRDVHAGVAGVGAAQGHSPEGNLEDAGRVPAGAEIQEEGARLLGAPQEVRVARGGGAPAVVLDEGVVRAQVRRHLASAHRAARDEFRRDPHPALPGDHPAHFALVVVGARVAGLQHCHRP